MTDTEKMVEGKQAAIPGLETAPKRRTVLEAAEEKAKQAEQRVKFVKAQSAAKQAPKLLADLHKQAVKDHDRAAAKAALDNFTETWQALIDAQLPETDPNSQQHFAVEDTAADG